MRALAALLAGVFILGGCVIVQDMYDDRARDECLELPTPDERRDCNRQVHDRELSRD